MHRNTRWIMLLAVALAGCEAGNRARPASSGAATRPQSTAAGNSTPAGPAIAYTNGVPVTWADASTIFYEAAGGTVLAELVLDRQLERSLAAGGLTVTPEDIREERHIMRDALADDENQGQRLLEQLRRRRGLGERRFDNLLRRNAALRKLVQSEVAITDESVRQAYDLKYGPTYEARLIVVDSATKASNVARQAAGGADFVQLVLANSTDESRAQGGLIGPFSPADPTWPQSIRDAVLHLQVGQVSPAVAIEHGFAIIKLERKIERPSRSISDVKEELTTQVRRGAERVLMERLARTLLDEADVVVLDPSLQRAWKDRQP